MATSKKTGTITLGAADRFSLEEWINGEYHRRWTTTDEQAVIEKLISSRKVTKTDIRKALAALRRARKEGNRRINQYGFIPRDRVALARLDEQIGDLAFHVRN